MPPTLRSKLEKVRSQQAGSGSNTVFGADKHKWQFLPPLTKAELEHVERTHAITLPETYRSYLLSISAGGAGPAYGLLTLQAALAHEDAAHSLAEPFPHTDVFNPALLDPNPNDEAYARQSFGTLALCHEGCGYYHRLVITGPTRGLMWLDARTSDGGFRPLGVTFERWFELWLDTILAGGNGGSWL